MTEADRETGSGAAGGGADWALSAAGREMAEAYLKEQTRLARLQADELVREDQLRRWSHRLHHVSDVMKVTFEVAVAVVGLAIVVIIGATVWSASHDDAAVIEAFKVPPDMAQRGLTGDVVASQLLDRLAFLQEHTGTVRAEGTYATDFGSDIKIEIPNTGVSLAEAYRYLAGWLGHQTHVSGEIFRTQSGIVLTARTNGHAGARFEANERDIDQLVERAAEYIYSQTQPFRYAVFLQGTNRNREADSIFRSLASNGSNSERAWAYADWMFVPVNSGNLAEALTYALEGAKLDRHNLLAQNNAAQAEAYAGHDEQVLQYSAAAMSAFNSGRQSQVTTDAADMLAHATEATIAEETGDFASALHQYDLVLLLPDIVAAHTSSIYMMAADAAKMHDVEASRRALGTYTDIELPRLSTTGLGWFNINFDFPQFQQYAALGDWRAARKDLEDALATPGAHGIGFRLALLSQSLPWLALTDAKTGDVASARRVIAQTPSDCYLCDRVRAQIELARNNPAGAAAYFARAVAAASSIPFAYCDWGEMLLREGKLDAAIAKFREANLKGPHFADPLEMWGEALMQQNRSDLALAKFEDANKYASNWGHLHLEWGKALFYAGRKEEAKRQFAMVSSLDLSSNDRAALAKWQGKT